ncbi:MAG: 2Fe-2S iron-sulfur cluster-binding protein [Gammaproteobacteria bacterium]
MTASYKITVEQTGDTFECAADDALLRGGQRAGVGLSYDCNVGGCGSCKFELVEGEVENMWEEAPGLNPRDVKRGKLLACQCRPKADSVIKMITMDEFVPQNNPQRFTGKLEMIRDLTSDIREFRFQAANGFSSFQPGQYALLNLPGVEGGRAYSMSNIGNEEGVWDFIIRLVPEGKGTNALFKLNEGDEIEIDGPYGMAYLRTEVPRDIVCVGGGSGLAPMLSIARGVAANPAMSGVNVHLFYGGRGPDDLCGQDEMQELGQFGERFHYYPAVSIPEMAEQAGWSGFVGFVHELARETIGEENLPNHEIYTCGPPPMINAVMQMAAVDAQVPPLQIHYDSFL